MLTASERPKVGQCMPPRPNKLGLGCSEKQNAVSVFNAFAAALHET
jgi:hypothetical protein